MKFALTAFPGRYALPGRPPNASPSALDAHKQTQFLLGDDLGLFERAMNSQLGIVAENKKARTVGAAAIVSLWSRTFSHLADGCALLCTGSYISCPPLLRTALDCVAVQRALNAGGFAEYEEWFAGAVSQAKEHQALAFDLGRFRAASVLAEDDRLGATYRLLTDLSMPHFGSIALQVGPESGLEKIVMSFADSAFHLGWAELTVGWLLMLADAQLRTLGEQDALPLSDDARRGIEQLSTEVTAAMSSARRCHVEEVEGRFLFQNFRRTASGQPKRVML